MKVSNNFAAFHHHLSSPIPTLRSQVDHPVRSFDHVQVVLDHDHRVAPEQSAGYKESTSLS